MKLHADTYSMAFYADGDVALELKSDGDIYVKGKLVENDKEVVEGLRSFLKKIGYFDGD